MAHRCCLIGLDLPSETTVGHIVAITAAIAQPNLDSQSKHALVLDFKRKLKSKCKGIPGEVSLLEFPSEPRDLPAERYAVAYGSGEPTSFWADHTLGDQCSVPLRRTSSKLRMSEPSSSSRPSECAPDMTQFMGFMRGLMQFAQGSSPAACPPLLQFRPPAPRPQGQMLTDTMHTTPQIQFLPSSPLAIADSSYSPPPKEAASTAAPSSCSPSTQVTKEDDGISKTQHPQFQMRTPDDPEAYAATVLNAMSRRDSVNKKPAACPASVAPTKKASPQKHKPVKKQLKASASSTGTRPAIPGKGSGTTWYLNGKIHRSESRQAWRVFVRKEDRCDKVSTLQQLFFNHTSTTFLCAVVHRSVCSL